MNILEIDQLSFSFGNQTILNNISFNVPEGAIFAYLGKNGSGKTTSIRIMLGLLQASAGQINYFGQAMNEQLPQLFYRIGNMIEGPCLYEHLSCYDNLQQMNLLFKRGKQRIDTCLEMVGLATAKHKKAKQLSTGMRQRLGLALALYHEPDFLVLDEPINGLDPVGVIDVRNLLLQLNANGVSIFLSSHILSEIEQLCTHVGILHQGVIKYQGTMQQFMNEATQQVSIRCSNKLKALELLGDMGLYVNIVGDNLVSTMASAQQFNAVIHKLVDAQLEIYNIYSTQENLEDLFLKCINH